LADLDPGMGGERAAVAGDTKAKATGDPAPPQHRLRRHCARQADRTGLRTDLIDCSRDLRRKIGMREPLQTPGLARRPGQEPPGRDETNGEASREQRDQGLDPQPAPQCSRLHRAVPWSASLIKP